MVKFHERKEAMNLFSKLKEINWKKLDVLSITIMTILLIVGAYCLRQQDIVSGGDTSLFKKQLLGIVIGLAVFLVAIVIDYRFICRYSFVLYTIVVLLLGYTAIFGKTINNVKRWIVIGGLTIQPSELAKFVIILFLAFLCDYLKEEMDRYRTLFILGAATALPIVLILLEPHLSSTFVFIFIFVVLVFMSGLSYKIIGKVLAVCVPIMLVIVIAVGVYDVSLPFIKPYQVKRVLSFLSDDESEDNSGKYQQNQSLTAVALGGKVGKIIDDQDTDARGYANIYANESDFVFAIVGEEFGFVGCVGIIFLYFVLVCRCLYIGTHAPDYMGRLICVGVSAMLMFQTFVNIGVATSLLPNTGLPLPFISSGLTSLINSVASVGMVVNVGMRSKTM